MLKSEPDCSARACQVLVCAALIALRSCSTLAADKSGVSPNAISVPKGPGAIEGLGESFQPSLNTGTTKYSITLKVPTGSAGQAPALSLAYEGGGGNGSLGFGWTLPTAYVQRRSDQGIPTYGENVGFQRSDTFINEIKEELVPLTNGFLFCKNEGAFIRYLQLSNHWQGTLPNGALMEFGLTDAGRVEDTNASPPHVFSWLLERETDTHGNVIVYSYTNFPGTNNVNQKYLSNISYGPGAPPWSSFHFVQFVYEDRPDWFEDCRPGFFVRTGKRLTSIVIGTQGTVLPTNHLAGDFNGDGVTDYLDRRYDLAYLNYAGANSFWSLLAQVQPVGADGVSTLPPSTFGYNVSDPPDVVSAADKVIGGLNEPQVIMDNSTNSFVEFVDLNGDGLPDVLVTYPSDHEVYLNAGPIFTNGQQQILWQSPVSVGGSSGDAQTFVLSSPAVHLADMNGDGLADLVVAQGNYIFFFPNQASNSWGIRAPMDLSDPLNPPPAPFGAANVRTADIDFDKNIDVILGDGIEYQIWFNFGNQQYSMMQTVQPSRVFDFSLPQVQIADLNGDRVPDIAQIWYDRVEVTPGLGYGQFGDAVSIYLPTNTPPLDDSLGQVQRAKLTDINGDGLADLVVTEYATEGDLYYWINQGNYTFSSRHVVTGMPSLTSPAATLRWADLNGNGTTDIIYADANQVTRLQTVDIGSLVSSGTPVNMLTAISNGIGRVTLIGYQPSTTFSLADASNGKPWPDPLPFPVQVVASVTNLDSLGHQYLTQFRYHNGYYDPVEKQFRGFASAEQIDVGDATAPTLVTQSVFDTGRTYEAMKGKLLALSAEQEDLSVFWKETNSWTVPPVTLYTGTNGTNVSYAHPTATVKLVTELGQGTPRLVESEFAYDNFGNRVTNADYGIVENGDPSAFNDERITSVQYALNLDAWNIRHPAVQEIADLSGVVISRTEYFYDDETFSGANVGSVSVGNLTSKRDWIDPSNPSAYVQSVRSKYDAFGNPVVLLDPLASASGGVVDPSQGHFRQIAYDGQFNTYPVTETIYLGTGHGPLVFQADYDAGFGTVLASLDFNTNQTTYGYDQFARLINIVKPGDTAAFPTAEYEYDLAVPDASGDVVNFIETRQLDKPLGAVGPIKRDYYFISRQFVDGLGRKLMTKTEAEAAPGSTTPRVAVSGAVQFNARQKPFRTLNPYFTLQGGSTLDQQLAFENIEVPGWTGSFHDSGALVTLNLGSAHATTTSYDATLREVQTKNPDGTFHATAFEPLLQRNSDENQTDPNSPYAGDSLVHYQDGLDRLVRVDEVVRLNDDGTAAATTNTWTTRYRYDVNDQLTQIVDSQNNVKSIQYDGLKRKTFMNDPDRGVMSFVYDDASNLIQSTDAKNQIITYTYDGANRILTEDYHDEGLPFSANFSFDPTQPLTRSNRPDVAYFYDVPVSGLPVGDGSLATARNTRGTLAYVWDLSGEEHTSFDERGRVEWVVKRIPDPVFQTVLNPQPPSGLVSYRTGFQYDSLDRTSILTYPDNDEVTYHYNDRNLLAAIPGGPNGSVISNLVYAPSGQMLETDYGNGVNTGHKYDSRLRLSSLTTASGQSPGSPLIAFNYGFDGVSNIKSITDQRPGSAVASGDPRRNTQVFSYDDLYRLTRVQYSFTAPGEALRNDGEIDYRYDRIGNMLVQNSTISDADNLTGLPVANLGTMLSGGSAGTSGRIGRQPTDPPGPHALTSIQNPASGIPNRPYPYDANGNMTVIDGLTNTWDFKDRLVAVENNQMRAEYTYDYTDRRITKKVKKKLIPSSAAR